MNDTAPGMEARYRAMLMQRSGKERLMMGCAVRVTAKILQMAGQEVRGSAPLISGSNEATSMIRRGLVLHIFAGCWRSIGRELDVLLLSLIQAGHHCPQTH